MTKVKKCLDALRDLSVGAKAEGKTGYINLMKIKAADFQQGPPWKNEADERVNLPNHVNTL